LIIPIPEHTLAARVSCGHNTYWFFDFQKILPFTET